MSEHLTSIDILEHLIAWPTISRQPNMELIHQVKAWLDQAGARTEIVCGDDPKRGNLFATMGPSDRRGIMLSGHSDVVPVEGQAWTRPAFKLTRDEGRLYGRGTADMKGFVACAVSAMIDAGSRNLKTPLHLALSYDEEIGCIGVRDLIEVMAKSPFQPRMAIIGEPTAMQVASGHKGKLALRAMAKGREGHSALAPLALNAIHLVADFVNALRSEQSLIVNSGNRDGDYDIAYTTLHAGKIGGGTALNIVPNSAVLDFEIRHLAEDDPVKIIKRLERAAQEIATATHDGDARLELVRVFGYPGLATPPDSEAIRFVQSLTGANTTCKVAFGTEAGLFSEKLGIPCVICGPGSMAQGHKPDEFVTVEQIERCDGMLARLLERLKD